MFQLQFKNSINDFKREQTINISQYSSAGPWHQLMCVTKEFCLKN